MQTPLNQISYEEFLEVELPHYFINQPNADEALTGLVSVARFWNAVWERCMAKTRRINSDYPYQDAIDLCEKYYEYVQRYLQENPVSQEVEPVLPDWQYISEAARVEYEEAEEVPSGKRLLVHLDKVNEISQECRAIMEIETVIIKQK